MNKTIIVSDQDVGRVLSPLLLTGTPEPNAGVNSLLGSCEARKQNLSFTAR
jgi:hypothetical protein